MIKRSESEWKCLKKTYKEKDRSACAQAAEGGAEE